MSWLRELAIDGHSWFEAFHIISVVCWFAALFYLPRLFVYHAMTDDTTGIERFKVMERKLYRGIANPSMIATVLLGGMLFLVAPRYYLSSGWFHAKLGLIGLLIAYHFSCRHFMLRLRNDLSNKSHIFFRWFNEAPVFMLIGIVIMVKVKPF